ncbi:MAG: biopolymer transporter ExbD [Gammaproteobacteria bacterium]
MSRRSHHRNKGAVVPELDITTFLNLMVVLVPFLLITAISIMELNIPAGAGGAVNKPKVTIEVIARKDRLEIGNGRGVIARLPNIDGKYDLAKLSKYLLKIKANYPKKTDATILVEPNIKYDNMVKVMDAVRVAEIKQEGEQDVENVPLFPDMSLGDAP